MTHDEFAERLTQACRLLAEHQIRDAYGHISARMPDAWEYYAARVNGRLATLLGKGSLS